MREIVGQLESRGLKYNENIFDRRFYQLYMWYREKMLCAPTCSLAVTERCTLKCRYCKVLTPYIDKPEDIALPEIKSDVDLFFAAFDYVCDFELFGGEPFLHPRLDEVIAYICENYREKFGMLKILTNGTISPSDRVMSAVKKYGVRLSISDYTETLAHLKPNLDALLESVKRNGIDYELRKRVKWWIDYGREYIDRSGATDEEISELFDACNIKCRLLKNGFYYNCQDDGFAYRAGIAENNSGFPLLNAVEIKPVLLEYECGFSDKGYVDLCRKCNGYLTINDNFIPVAEQLERKSGFELW
jgi:organic radical activating enzyme